MNVTWLQVFREVAKRGSLSAAADALGYTQPSVTRHISALESATGVRLLDRLPRGVRLTEEGRCLLPHAEAVLDRLDTAAEDLAALRMLEAGRLRVGAFDSADTVLVPRAMAAFRAEHPRVELSLVEGNSRGQVEHLLTGRTDVSLVSGQSHPALALRPLMVDPMLVALPAGHRLAAHPELRLADLSSEHWVEGFSDAIDSLNEACGRAGYRPHIDFGAREWTAKQGFVLAGLGIALVPSLIAPVFPAGIVLRPLPQDEFPARTIHVATLAGATMAPLTAAFVRFLEAAAAQLSTTP
jgi:DNA-binding transcriptional LysR family regulator